MKRLILLFTVATFIVACGDKISSDDQINYTDLLHQSVKQLTDALVFDITSPPLASRSYAYPCLAAYYAMHPELNTEERYYKELNAWEFDPVQVDGKVNFEAASILAFLTIAEDLVYTKEQFSPWKDSLYGLIKSNLELEHFNSTRKYADQVIAQIRNYAGSDGLQEVRTMGKYVVKSAKEGNWIPTPPNYMDPIEPNWNQLRPFTLDSAAQFAPERPTAFDLNKGSLFYEEMMEVYEVRKEITEEQKEIAAFWDCNPYVVLHNGHFMQPIKKITPGGHWMGIAGIICKMKNVPYLKAARTYSVVSIALADAFISCWDEKYRSNYIRPETVINIHVDNLWEPVLQTPPFPEYTSGHSVISTAAAHALTNLYGDSVAFEDDVELEYGLSVRNFDSFIQASQEAAISRLYGGIHFRPAIENGVSQGQKVAQKVINTLNLK